MDNSRDKFSSLNRKLQSVNREREQTNREVWSGTPSHVFCRAARSVDSQRMQRYACLEGCVFERHNVLLHKALPAPPSLSPVAFPPIPRITKSILSPRKTEEGGIFWWRRLPWQQAHLSQLPREAW